MQPLSAAFKTAINTGYRIASTVTVTGGISVPVTSGVITVDRNSDHRRRCTLQVTADAAYTLVPTALSSPLTPFGNEVTVKVGWNNPTTGTAELISVGVFAMTTVTVEDSANDLVINIDGYDRSWVVAQRKFTGPYVVAGGTAPETAIQGILNSQYPGLPALSMPPTGFTIPSAGLTWKEKDDPWAACLAIADGAGCELFFDVNGIPTGRPIPLPSTQPTSWTFDSTAGSGAVRLARKFTREGVVNDYTVTGTGSGNAASGPVRSSAQKDTNPNSPTYVSGPFGDIPDLLSSNTITTVSQANQAASNLLTASLGKVEQLTVSCVPNPAFDVDDVIYLNRPRIGVNGTYVVDSIRHTLQHNDRTELTCRKV